MQRLGRAGPGVGVLLDPACWRVDNAAPAPEVRWQSGDAEDCKSSNAGSIPARTSTPFPNVNAAAVLKPFLSTFGLGLPAVCSLFAHNIPYSDAVHGRHGEASLIHGARVALDLTQRLVSRDGGDLVRRAPGFRQPPCSGLSKPVRRASLRHASHPRPLRKPAGEACIREAAAVLRGDEGQLPGRHLRQLVGQGRVNGHGQTRASLLLRERQGARRHVLPPHPRHVARPLPGVEQQRERQSRACACRPMRLERGNVGLCPLAEPIRGVAEPANAERRIVRPHATVDCEAHQDAQAITQVVDRPVRPANVNLQPSNSGFGDFFSSFGGGALLGAIGGGVLGYFLGRDSRSGLAQNQSQYPYGYGQQGYGMQAPGQFIRPYQSAPAFLPLLNGQRSGLPASYPAPFNPQSMYQGNGYQTNLNGGGVLRIGGGGYYGAGGAVPISNVYNGAYGAGYPGGSFGAQYPTYQPSYSPTASAPAILPYPGPRL